MSKKKSKEKTEMNEHFKMSPANANFLNDFLSMAEEITTDKSKMGDLQELVKNFINTETDKLAKGGLSSFTYNYNSPDYSKMVNTKDIDKKLSTLLPVDENDDPELEENYDSFLTYLHDWPKDKLVHQFNQLIYAHLASWKGEDEIYKYGLRVTLALVEHFRLCECLPAVLEIMRQDEEFMDEFFAYDDLDDIPVALLSNIITEEELTQASDFMKEEAILPASKQIVALAVAHLPKNNPSLLSPVRQWLSDVLNYYYPMESKNAIFNEDILEMLIYCCVHTNAEELKPLLIKIYNKFDIPEMIIKGGCNEMQKQIKKAKLGTIIRDNAEQILIKYLKENGYEEDDYDDYNDYDDYDEINPDFDIEEYEMMEYNPWTMNPKAIYKDMPSIKKYKLRISLEKIKPEIWREVEVPSNLTLTSLASVIILAMGWDEDHLHQFIVGKQKSTQFYATSVNEVTNSFMMESKDGSKFCVGEILQNEGDNVKFEYDYGDSWIHKIALISSSEYKEEDKRIKLLAGKHACPPEDCGGVTGYTDICNAMKNPNTAKAQRLIEWLGARFDPEYYPLEKAQKIVDNYNA